MRATLPQRIHSSAVVSTLRDFNANRRVDRSTYCRHTVRTAVFIFLSVVGVRAKTLQTPVGQLDHPSTIDKTTGALQSAVIPDHAPV